SSTLLLHCRYTPPRPHSFPTRRSSDLTSDALLRRSRSDWGRDDAHDLGERGVGLEAVGVVEGVGDHDQLVGLGQFGEGFEACLQDRKSTRLNSSHVKISYAVFCLKKKK